VHLAGAGESSLGISHTGEEHSSLAVRPAAGLWRAREGDVHFQRALVIQTRPKIHTGEVRSNLAVRPAAGL
jgi:hypothetical protein